NSNDRVPNPNITVFEWLNSIPGYQGRVAAFCCWDVFPFILNRARGGVLVHAGWEPIGGVGRDDVRESLNRLVLELPRAWSNSHYDGLAFEAALHHLQGWGPRVLYIGFGETDEYAHEGRYDLYLDAAHQADGMIAELWRVLQSHLSYRGSTTLVL